MNHYLPTLSWISLFACASGVEPLPPAARDGGMAACGAFEAPVVVDAQMDSTDVYRAISEVISDGCGRFQLSVVTDLTVPFDPQVDGRLRVCNACATVQAFGWVQAIPPEDEVGPKPTVPLDGVVRGSGLQLSVVDRFGRAAFQACPFTNGASCEAYTWKPGYRTLQLEPGQTATLIFEKTLTPLREVRFTEFFDWRWIEAKRVGTSTAEEIDYDDIVALRVDHPTLTPSDELEFDSFPAAWNEEGFTELACWVHGERRPASVALDAHALLPSRFFEILSRIARDARTNGG